MSFLAARQPHVRQGSGECSTLARVFADGGRLTGVSYSVFADEHPFVTACALHFDRLTAVFRAVPDDDTLAASVGELVADPNEITVDTSGLHPWSQCIGLGVCWGWRLTNQQGYVDGVRLEFGQPDEVDKAVVELVVVASGIGVFVSAWAETDLTKR